MPMFDFFKRRRVERRKHARKKIIETAWIRAKVGDYPWICVLWDISEGGARIAVSTPEAVPNEFDLLLDRDQERGTRCRLAWRTHEQIGIEFLEGAELIRHFLEKQPTATSRGKVHEWV
jgi:hypothetical protein